MTWPAAGGDAGEDGDAEAADAFADGSVEVRRPGRFEFGFAAHFERQPAQAVHDGEDDL